MSPFGRTNQQQMPHHHLEGQPIEGPLGEARHPEELKLFPIALVQQVCSRLYHRCSCQLFRSVAQGGIKCGNRGTGFLDSEGSHR